MKVFLLLVLNIVAHVNCVQDTASVIRQLGKHADVRVRPLDGTNKNVNVSISLLIVNLFGKGDDSNELSMDVYFRKRWTDPRMTYTDGPAGGVILTPEMATKLLWMPDLFFSNAREVNIHETLKPNYAARVKEDGSILLSSRLTLLVHCNMDLRRFPFDESVCHVKIESYFYDSNDMNISWVENGVKASSEFSSGNEIFSLMGISTDIVTRTSSTGEFQILRCSLRLKRNSAHFVVLTFIPSFLLVVLSCLLFWMPTNALLERSLFSIFLIFSHTTIMISCLHTAPEVSYLKCLDVWLLSCFIFLFVCCIQVVVLVLLARSSASRKQDQFELIDDEASRASGDTKKEVWSVGLVKPETLGKVDMALRVLYPAAFIAFNVIFWITFKS